MNTHSANADTGKGQPAKAGFARTDPDFNPGTAVLEGDRIRQRALSDAGKAPLLDRGDQSSLTLQELITELKPEGSDDPAGSSPAPDLSLEPSFLSAPLGIDLPAAGASASGDPAAGGGEGDAGSQDDNRWTEAAMAKLDQVQVGSGVEHGRDEVTRSVLAGEPRRERDGDHGAAAATGFPAPLPSDLLPTTDAASPAVSAARPAWATALSMTELPARVAHLAGGLTEGGSATVRLHLNPPALGEIRLQIESTRHGIQVRIVTQSQEACALLADGRGRLSQELWRHGLTLQSFTASMDNRGAGSPDSRQQPSAERSPRRARDPLSAIPPPDVKLAPIEGGTGRGLDTLA